MASEAPILEVRDLSYHIPIRRGVIFPRRVGTMRAVDGVSFNVAPGESMALVGESGAGKTTVGLLTLALLRPTSGEVRFEGRDLHLASRAELREARKKMQLIFQDPLASFNPHLRVGRSIELPLRNYGWGTDKERRARVAELMELVGLNPSFGHHYPHQFSGGQLQRLAIARALALHPKYIVLDEPVTALDVSIQGQILNLLRDLQQRFGLTYLFVAHNLNVVYYVADRIAVMYRGRIAEMGPRDKVFSSPRHPHTRALLSSILRLDRRNPEAQLYQVNMAHAQEDISVHDEGCVYRMRCPYREELCFREVPALKELDPAHFAACHVAARSPPNWLSDSAAPINGPSRAQKGGVAP